jgi:hypothetical protein
MIANSCLPDQNLHASADRALEEAENLRSLLNKIQQRQDQAEHRASQYHASKHLASKVREKAFNAWNSSVIALETVWKLDTIRKSYQRLTELRQDLSSQTLAMVNSRLENQGDRIVEIHAICNQMLAEFINDQTLPLGEPGQGTLLSIKDNTTLRGGKRVLIEGTRPVIKKTEAATAVLIASNGTARAVGRPWHRTPNQSSQDLSSIIHPHFVFQKKSTARSRNDTEEDALKRDIQHRQGDGMDISLLTRPIVESLHFRTINEREERISEPYQKTFEWIWDESKSRRKWTNFPRWLRSGTGIYWINVSVI